MKKLNLNILKLSSLLVMTLPFNIAGNLNILGSMSVEMWDGFQLSSGMSFLIADIGGTRSGTFAGFGEGDLVGTFGGQNLFISYSLGNGNDIGLFTAIPEPGTSLLLAAFSTIIASRRRRVTGLTVTCNHTAEKTIES